MESSLIALMGFYYFYIVALGFYMFVSRFRAVRARELNPRYFKTYQGEIPEALKALENHFTNQFQIPLVFMITSLTAIHLQQVHSLFFGISLAFVLSRLVHSFVHLTSNKILLRASCYFLGVVLLALLWLLILL